MPAAAEAAAPASGSDLKLSPVAAILPGNTRYTVKLAAAIADTRGRTLPAAYARTFSTAPQAWGQTAAAVAPLPYFTANTQPLVASDSAGNVMAVWHYQSGAGETLYAARWPARPVKR